jgi:hypothetical protein
MSGNATKRDAVTRLLLGKIADGTLRPGAPVPSGAALARETGYASVTCLAALRALHADGTLARGPSRGARLRVAPPQGQRGAPASGAPADAPGQHLSRELAARRRAAGLTQPELAKMLGMSVTTVGHAETGRLWQSRGFWERADGVLLADGALLHLHEQYQAAVVRPAPAGRPEAAPAAPAPPALPASVSISPGGVTVTWPDGTTTVARPPGWRG